MAAGVRGRFEEQQAFAAFLYVLLACLVVVGFFPPIHMPLSLIPFVIAGVVGNMLYVRTTVTDRDVRVSFGYLVPFYVRSIPLAEIESVEPVEYSPIGEYGGWGIRGVGSNVALNARGNLGVRLALTGGRTLLIGSQRPNELAVAIREAKHGR